MDFKSRIIEFIEYKGLNKAAFEKLVGLSNDTVNKMGENTRVSTIDKISKAFPELNTNWLRTGIGEMIKQEKPKYQEGISIGHTNDKSYNQELTIKEKDEMIRSLLEQLKSAHEEIGALKERVRVLEEEKELSDISKKKSVS